MQLEGVRVFIIGSHFSSRWSWDGFKIWILLYMLRFQCSAEFTNLASSLYCQPDTWGRLQSILVQYIDLGELLKGQLENCNCNLKRVNLLPKFLSLNNPQKKWVSNNLQKPSQVNHLVFFCWLCWLNHLWFHPPVVPPFRGWCFGLLPEGKVVVAATAMSDPQVDRKNLMQTTGLINKISPFWMVLVKNHWRSCCCGKKTRGVFGGGIIVSTCK